MEDRLKCQISSLVKYRQIIIEYRVLNLLFRFVKKIPTGET